MTDPKTLEQMVNSAVESHMARRMSTLKTILSVIGITSVLGLLGMIASAFWLAPREAANRAVDLCKSQIDDAIANQSEYIKDRVQVVKTISDDSLKQVGEVQRAIGSTREASDEHKRQVDRLRVTTEALEDKRDALEQSLNQITLQATRLQRDFEQRTSELKALAQQYQEELASTKNQIIVQLKETDQSRVADLIGNLKAFERDSSGALLVVARLDALEMDQKLIATNVYDVAYVLREWADGKLKKGDAGDFLIRTFERCRVAMSDWATTNFDEIPGFQSRSLSAVPSSEGETARRRAAAWDTQNRAK